MDPIFSLTLEEPKENRCFGLQPWKILGKIDDFHFGLVDIVDTVDTADIVHTVDTLDIVKSVNSVDNVSSVNSVHNVHDTPQYPKIRMSTKWSKNCSQNFLIGAFCIVF